MKKLLPLILIVLMLTACGKPVVETAEETPAPETASPIEIPEVSNTPENVFSKEMLIEIIDTYTSESGAPSLTSISPVEEILEDGTLAIGYEVCDGMSVYFYENSDTEKFSSVFLSLDISKADKVGTKFFGVAAGVIIMTLDKADSQNIMAKIDIGNPDIETPAVAVGSNASYAYIIDGNLHMFSATLK